MSVDIPTTESNVFIYDYETNDLIFHGHNLFLDVGKAFLADLAAGHITVTPSSHYLVSLGDSHTSPSRTNTGLIGNTIVSDITYPSLIDGSSNVPKTSFGPSTSTEVELKFDYRNETNPAVDIVFSELLLQCINPTNNAQRYTLSRIITGNNSIMIVPDQRVIIKWVLKF